VAATRRQLARDLVGDVRLLDRRITAVEARIREAVITANTSLLGLHGVGPVLAAWILEDPGPGR
jgi:transposase